MTLEEKSKALCYLLGLFIQSGKDIHTFSRVKMETLVNEFVLNFGEITANLDFEMDMGKYRTINVIENNFAFYTYGAVINIMLEAYKDKLNGEILSLDEYEALPKDKP